MVNQKLVLEIEEPEADQFFRVKKSVNIPPRHYAVTHIQSRDFKKKLLLDMMRNSNEQTPQCGQTLSM